MMLESKGILTLASLYEKIIRKVCYGVKVYTIKSGYILVKTILRIIMSILKKQE